MNLNSPSCVARSDIAHFIWLGFSASAIDVGAKRDHAPHQKDQTSVNVVLEEGHGGVEVEGRLGRGRSVENGTALM